jgi:hypothetical protein
MTEEEAYLEALAEEFYYYASQEYPEGLAPSPISKQEIQK